ncbi:alpha/beta fold hydrolase [Amycolatopsis sp. NPDC004625]|uniref:alpha/beta fold hydrolase n=1 Tax=Amycolatopsis sp. NPDC004625 TaxID=3154670 RepID=UPI0033BEE693
MIRSQNRCLSLLLTVLGVFALLAVGNAHANANANPGAALIWGSCPGGGGPDGVECALLQVPVDWAEPDGRRLTLAVGRLKADGPGPAEGTLLVNYGGPIGTQIEIMRDRTFTPDFQPFADLRHTMNIVTWDLRGYPGLSSPTVCGGPADVPHGQRYPRLPRDQAGFDALATANRAAISACRDKDPGLFDSLDSATFARDADAVRQALGEGRINLYMGSYGSVIGEAYANLFPGHVRTMMIDGGFDHAGSSDVEDQARARDNEQQAQRFFGWCASTSSCVLHGRNVPRIWRALVARAESVPIPAPQFGAAYDGTQLQWHLIEAIVRAEQQPAPDPGWGQLAQAIQRAEAGDASGFGADTRDLPFTPCLDWPRPTGYGALAATQARLARIAPDTGSANTTVWRALECVGWPAPMTNPPRPFPPGVPPLLGAGTWAEFGATARVVRHVPGSFAIRHDGGGHELYATGNRCVIAYADTYFTTRRLPAPGSRC